MELLFEIEKTFNVNSFQISQSVIGSKTIYFISFLTFSFGLEHIQSPDIWSPTIVPQEQTVRVH